MFDLTPFDRNERKLMNLFDRFDRDFFGNFDQSLAAFRTDIVDKGDHYELEADLPWQRQDPGRGRRRVRCRV